MPLSADIYMCNVCDSRVRIVNGSETPPTCCQTEMEQVTDKLILNRIPTDKNVCGATLACQSCNFKVIMVNDQGTVPQHCMHDMKITIKSTISEKDQIYKCDSCGQIIKITKEGCGPIRCCDAEICIMDVKAITDLQEKIDIQLEKVHDKPFDDPYVVCPYCEREVKILKQGEGNVICHGKPMEKRARFKYYFQGGG